MSWEHLSVEELADAIDKEGFHSAAEMFKDQEIKGSVIPLITDEHLKEMGLMPVGTRLLLLKYLKKLCNGAKAPSSNSSRMQNREEEDQFYQTAPPVQQAHQTMGHSPARTSKPSASTTKARPSTTKTSSRYPDGEVPKYVRDHEKMVENMRAARRLAAYEKAKAEGKDVGPPPEMPEFEEPEGLVQCPTCGRKMSEEAAKHHFPVCERMAFNKSNKMRAGRY